MGPFHRRISPLGDPSYKDLESFLMVLGGLNNQVYLSQQIEDKIWYQKSSHQLLVTNYLSYIVNKISGAEYVWADAITQGEKLEGDVTKLINEYKMLGVSLSRREIWGLYHPLLNQKLCQFARDGKVQDVRDCLKKGANVNAVSSWAGLRTITGHFISFNWTALHFATYKGHLK